METTLSLGKNAFNEDWKFHLGEVDKAYIKDFDDGGWRTLSLPHDYSIEQDFSNEIRGEIGHLPGGVGWYRKHFVLSPDFKDKKVFIDFDGAYMDTNIYINGKFVGNYPNGYMPFSYDISDHVICDGVTENVLCVRTECVTGKEAASSRWYSGSGIYRDVYLRILNKVYVPQYGLTVTTPKIDEEYDKNKGITLEIITEIQNDTEKEAEVTVRYTVLNYKDGTSVCAPFESETVVVPKGKNRKHKKRVKADLKLWSVDEPTLYYMLCEVIKDGVVIDRGQHRFGVRYTDFHKDRGFSLNGKRMKLHGVCMHHDQGALGACAYEAAIARQIRIMKEMGANAIRVTHNPAAEVLLKQCDEQGFLVVEEAFDTLFCGKKPYDYHRFFELRCTHPQGKKMKRTSKYFEYLTWGEFDLRQMIRRGKNYPSIIMWSLGNELRETNLRKGLSVIADMVKWAKAEDTTRPVTMGDDKYRFISPDHGERHLFTSVAKHLDVVGINYGANHYDGYRELMPDLIFYGSETSSAVKSRGYFSDPHKITDAQEPVPYQLSSFDNCPISHGDTATTTWICDRDREWVCGQFIWTGFDYLGEPSPFSHETWGVPKNSYFGICDTAGFPKTDYFLYQSQWRSLDDYPMVHIFPHLNFDDEEQRSKVLINGKLPIRVYSNAPVIELFLNGKSLGEKRYAIKKTSYGKTYFQQSEESDRLYLEWLLDYDFPIGTEVKAVAKDFDGKVVACDTVIRAGEPRKIKLSADKKEIKANDKDLCYITVDICDKDGAFVPNAMNEVYFEIIGDGEIVGVDNGNPISYERFKSTDGIWKRKTFNGKALVIVKSTKRCGSFTLTAAGEGLEITAITVKTF